MRGVRRKSNDAAFTEKAWHDCAGGEHTGAGRGCKGRPQCGTVHEKTERRNKNRQHANSQQRDDRVKEYTVWHHGSILWVKCVVERPELGMDRRQERELMLQTKTHEPFPKIGNVRCSKNETCSFLREENVDLLFYLIISITFYPHWTIVNNLWVAPPVLPVEGAWIQLSNLYNFSIKQCVQITFIQISWKETFSHIRLK